MNNPPAFPQPIHKANHDTRPEDFKKHECDGMSLRDYFAAAAMQGIITAEESKCEQFVKIAAWAYEQADAMLKAREQ